MAGRPIAEIVARDGEGVFRDLEGQTVQALDGAGRCVIATGGWTVAATQSRSMLESLGTIVCLTGPAEVLAERLSADVTARPLLGGTADPQRLRAILNSRRPVYDSLPLQVDTVGRTASEIADQVLAVVAQRSVVGGNSIPVQTPTGGYSVLVGEGLLDAFGALLGARGRAGRVAVVSDPTVGALYFARVRGQLEGAGFSVARFEMGEGELAKNLSTVQELYRGFVNGDLDRQSAVLALGGGVVGDTAGFAAATFLRGVPVIQVPTTLLAMVDASIGGKTGVNLPAGKNLVGAFHHPELVLIDPAVLASLAPDRLRDGLAEVVKAAIIGDPELLDQLEREGAPSQSDTTGWLRIVRRAASVKAAIVSDDPHEHGRRILLNLGHTFAHAIEQTSDYRMTHGQAVSVGLVAAARLAERLGLTASSLYERIESVLSQLGLPVRYQGPDPDAVQRAMWPDKKRAQGRVRFVLPRAPADVTVVDDVPEADVLACITSVFHDTNG